MVSRLSPEATVNLDLPEIKMKSLPSFKTLTGFKTPYFLIDFFKSSKFEVILSNLILEISKSTSVRIEEKEDFLFYSPVLFIAPDARFILALPIGILIQPPRSKSDILYYCVNFF